MKKLEAMSWRCHTPNLLEEILKNPGTGILQVPLKLFGQMLGEVADRAVQLNDPELNRLMLRLTLYSAADPESPDYMGEEALTSYLRGHDAVCASPPDDVQSSEQQVQEGTTEKPVCGAERPM